MPPPKKPRKPRFPEYFSREDELQEYQLTAARLQDAASGTIQRCTKERWDDYWEPDKRRLDPKLTRAQLIDRADWDAFREGQGGEDVEIVRRDVRRAIASACQVYPRPVVLAACELMSVCDAARACGQRKKDVCDQVEEARGLLQELLKDYREKG